MFNENKTSEIYIDNNLQSIFDIEKIIIDFIKNNVQNLIIFKFSKTELNKINQINFLIDNCLLTYNNTKIKKYFIFLIYFNQIKDNNNNLKNVINEINNSNNIDLRNDLITFLSNNCYQFFIDNLFGKNYEVMEILSMKMMDPALKDLKLIANEIAKSIDEKVSVKYNYFLEKIAKCYYDYIEQKKKSDIINMNFHGLRDFYSIIKSTAKELSKNNEKINDDNNNIYLDSIAMKYIERNFGGLPESVYDLKLKYYQIENNNFDKSKLENNYDIIQNITDNLLDKESRYLLLITKNNLGLDLINYIIENINNKNKNEEKFKTKILTKSTFIKDKDEDYIDNILNIIKNEMQTNNLLILNNFDNLYPHLYDVFNQDFTKIENEYYTKISFGYWNPLENINKNFKIIIVMDEKNLLYENPPFLQRFEKHIFNFDNLLSKEEKKISKQIFDIINEIVKFLKSKNDTKKFLIDLNLEEIEGLVYKYNLIKKNNNDYKMDIKYEILKLFVSRFTEEIISSLLDSGFKENHNDIFTQIIDIYKEKHPSNFIDFLFNKMTMQKNIIYTYSSITEQLSFICKNKNEINSINNINTINDINNINDINDNFSLLNNNNNINDINDNDLMFNENKTAQFYIYTMKTVFEIEPNIIDLIEKSGQNLFNMLSIFEIEKAISDFLQNSYQNLLILKFCKTELDKINQINYLIDNCLSGYNNPKIKKYIVLLIYLNENDDISIVIKNEIKGKISCCHDDSKMDLLTFLSNNCYQILIDKLSGKIKN